MKHYRKYWDNSKTIDFLSCPRKGFWTHIYGGQGIVPKPSPALRFGSSLHAGLAAYYLHGMNREAGVDAFREEWETLFEEEPPKKKHSLEAGLFTMEEYFSYYEEEDKEFEILEIEIGGAFPLPGVDAVYHGRSDGLIRRRGGNIFLFEHKSTSYGVVREIGKLECSRQVEGYLWLWGKLLPEYGIRGVLGNGIAVLDRGSRAQRFCRNYFYVAKPRIDLWEQETVRVVGELQGKIDDWEVSQDETIFIRNTDSCLRYGRCPYMDLCLYGVQECFLDDFQPNEWDPLGLNDMKEKEEEKDAAQN